MKRLFTALTLICLVFAFVPSADAQVKFRGFTALTGGGTGSLDKIPIAELVNGDIGFVATDTYFYVFKFNGTATNAESSPNYIRPNDYTGSGLCGGPSDCGVWVLTGLYGVTLKGGPSATPTIEFYDSDATDGDINGAIYVNCTTNTSGAEVCSIYFQTQGLSAENVAGTLTTRLTIDTANNLIDTSMAVRGAIEIITASSTPLNLTAAQTLGSIVFASYAGSTTINLPDYTSARSASKAKIGSSVCIYSSLAQLITVDMAADDKIRLDGTLGAAGVAITSDAAAGDYSCFVLTDAASDVGHWTMMGYGKTAWQVP